MSTNCSRSHRPLSPPTSFIRAPGSATLNTRVFAVFTRYNRTTSPACALNVRSGSPPTSSRSPNRPIAV